MRHRSWMRWLAICLWAAGFVLAGHPAARAQGETPPVVVMHLKGPVNPIWQETIARAIRTAEQQGASAIILELDTPGGSVTTMAALVQQLRGSPLPVIVYVTPAGAMAASAGTLITLAGHAAVMAPETTIGAASPVGSQGENIPTTEETKVKEVLKASARGLAEGRGAEAVQLAEAMIDEARAVSAPEALQAGLVDAVARDMNDLLAQMDGRTVTVQRAERDAGHRRGGSDRCADHLPRSSCCKR